MLAKHDLNLYPEITVEELEELKTSLSAGYDKTFPIIEYENKVLDGWNRYRACLTIGIDPVLVHFHGTRQDALELVIRSNKRRNLTAGQRACLAAEYEPVFAAEAKKRMLAGVKADPAQKIAEGGEAREQAGEMFGVNRQYVSDAKKLRDEAPEQFERVKNGKDTLVSVKKKIKKERMLAAIKETEKLPETKYRIVYADPPWFYASEQHGKQEQETTQKSTHYPSMKTADIAALPVSDMTDDNAVLFLWTTSPKLFEAQEVIRGWGFTYKANMVWDKVKHNVGYYVSVRHEHLLICTKGSCTPDVKKLHDSVYAEERTEHSRKPDFFRDLIDELYPHGKRIELFARERHGDWDSWGNQL